MQLLADENQHPLVVSRLRGAGHMVEWIAERSPGVADSDILGLADIGNKVLLTYDRDFGDLIFNRGFPAPFAIIYTRLSRAEPDFIADRLIAVLDGAILAGHIVTIVKDGARSRPFPGAKND